MTIDAPELSAARSGAGGSPRTRNSLWGRDVGGRLPLPLVGLALLAGLARLPYLLTPMMPDEGGFLMVAHQWGHGSSLYGNYWVDRPPLLIGLFWVADQLGRVVGPLAGLRLVGVVAVSVTVLAVGVAALRVAGRRAALWSGGTAAVLLVTPLVGATAVNGELLATPFIAAGVAFTTVALTASSTRRAVWAAALAGAAGVAAVLVKQNMVDVFVFAAVAVVLAGWRKAASTGVVRLVLAAGAGAVAALVVLLGLAASLGTMPGAVLFAMYPFRVRAAGVMGHAGVNDRVNRLSSIAFNELISGGLVVLVVLAVALVLRRFGSRPLAWAVSVATVLLGAYGVFSVLAGGSYWTHYLVQLIVPTALATGLLVSALPRLGAVLGTLVVLVGVVTWGLGLVGSTGAPGPVIGDAIGASAKPGDTMVSLLGDADILETAGLTSPYTYLWSLPARTLDPHLHRLTRVLSGPKAPTWIAVRNAATQKKLDQEGTGAVMRAHYHQVAVMCGHTIYLRNGVRRPPLARPSTCTRPLTIVSPVDLSFSVLHPSKR